jgi:hypothetical protein
MRRKAGQKSARGIYKTRYHEGLAMGTEDALSAELEIVGELLRKYQYYGQAQVIDEILATFSTPNPDFKRLAGIEMWGGAGAVWETVLNYPAPQTNETQIDERAFREAIIRISAAMDVRGIGTDRSRFIAKTFQNWRGTGVYPWS